MKKNLALTHTSNVTSMRLLILVVISLGNAYNVVAERLKLATLKLIHDAGASAIATVDELLPPNVNAKTARDILFDQISSYVTRIANAFSSIETNPAARRHVRSLVSLIQSGRVNEKKSTLPVGSTTVEPSVDKENESHKMKIDARLDNFYKLIQLLASFPGYVPNEPDLTVASITLFYENLKNLHQLVEETEGPLARARNARDIILYANIDGLVDTGKDAKGYIKSVFGAKSPEYKSVSKLKFTNFKK